MNKKKFFRILDVNLNRTREGLRVCEDILRFLFENKELTKQLKSLRHKINKIASSGAFNRSQLLEYRNIYTNKTKYINFKNELTRQNVEEIFESNIQRVQESFRVLEEIIKLEDLKLSKRFKQLRFKTYDIEKNFFYLYHRKLTN